MFKMKKYYTYFGDNLEGPFDFKQLESLDLKACSLIWDDQLNEWKEAQNIEELEPFFKKKLEPCDTENKILNNLVDEKIYKKNRKSIINSKIFYTVLGLIILSFCVICAMKLNIVNRELSKITELTKNLFVVSVDKKNEKNNYLDKSKEDETVMDKNNRIELFNKKIKSIEILLINSYEKLDYWKNELNNVNNLKYLKTKAEKNEYILNAENGIKLWEDEIARLQNEMKMP